MASDDDERKARFVICALVIGGGLIMVLQTALAVYLAILAVGLAFGWLW